MCERSAYAVIRTYALPLFVPVVRYACRLFTCGRVARRFIRVRRSLQSLLLASTSSITFMYIAPFWRQGSKVLRMSKKSLGRSRVSISTFADLRPLYFLFDARSNREEKDDQGTQVPKKISACLFL